MRTDPLTRDAPDPANLELSPGEMRRMTAALANRVIAHLASLPDQPASGDVAAAELCWAMREPAPEHGTPLDGLLDRYFTEWLPRSFTAPGPGYLAYIPGGGLYPSALADYLAAATNRYTGVWQAAPALVQLEANTLDWLRDWMQFPATTRGLYTTGGSMSNFNAILCARERHLGADIRRGTVYTSTQAHHSIAKAARLAGIMPDRIRTIEVDDAFRMRLDALARAIADDRRAGLRPFAIVSTAGTTNTGAVDPLDAIAELAARDGLWHHVDGAYGAFFHVVPELRPLLAGLPSADSVTLDPHKGLFLPYGTGALLVRDGTALHAAHRIPATVTYLPEAADLSEFYNPAGPGPDLSRGYPGWRVWLCVKLFGTARLRAAIAEKRTLALDAAERIRGLPHVVLDAPPQLSLFAFHLSWSGATRDEENRATQALLARVRGRVLLTGCWHEGRYLARVCVLSFRTRQDRIDDCVRHIAEESAALLADTA